METDHYSRPSFESPHNNVHNAVGCADGTMYDLNWSAFDPVFMLHHANVDRLIALWQAIYYNSSIYTIADYESALYGTAAGLVGDLTPLKPFYDVTGNFHTSESVRNISIFGYTYPELQPTMPGGELASVSADELSSYVKFRVNALYADNLTTAASSGSTSARRFMGPRKAQGTAAEGVIVNKTWSVVIQVDKAQMPLPATVDCYLGASLAGTMALLGIPATGVTHSTVPLDRALAVSLADLGDDEAVLEFLAQSMRFEVHKVS
jgi:tyrosinase